MRRCLTYLLITLSSLMRAYAQQPELVLYNGRIITLQRPGHRAEAVAVRAGRILAVGSNAEIKKMAGAGTRMIDLQGRTVTPGFNDVHQHPQPIYSWDKPYASLRLDTVGSMQSLILLIKRKAAITPKGMLITGVGYNEVKLGGQPIRDSLDKATIDHPVLLSHASGHISAANSPMLMLNGIDRSTKDPAGGAFERYQDGMPDGIVKESARLMLNAARVVHPPAPTHEEELEGYRKYFHDMLAGGLTSIGDCWVTPEKVNIYKTLVAEQFPLRFNLYIGVDYLDQLIGGQIGRTSSEWLRIGGVKFFHGNSLSGKTCWLNDPYDTINPVSGKKDYYGIPPVRSQGSLDSLVLKIHTAGLQIACHSNGDREIEMLITAIERAQQQAPRTDARHRIEHCSVTTREMLERIRKDSIVPVFHTYINELGRQLMVYGPARLSMMMPTRTAMEMGITYALHSDYPISNYHAMRRLSGAVNRITADGIVLGAEQKIDAEDAIRASTVGGAYTTHEEDQKGRIVKGQLADMVVLDKDPSTIAPEGIGNIAVMMTIVGGRVAYQKK